MDVDMISQIDWIKRWAGSYTFISCSYWGKQYKYSLEKYLGVGFDNVLFVHKRGTASFFVSKKDLDNFGKTLSGRVEKDTSVANCWCQKLKTNTDKIKNIMDKIGESIPNPQDYKEFENYFFVHLAFHNAVKKTVDYFSAEILQETLPIFKEARLYSESIYSDTESFFRGIMREIAQKEGCNPDYLTCLTEDEFKIYLNKGILPDSVELEKRYNLSALYYDEAQEKVLDDKETDKLLSLLNKKIEKIEEVKGVSAFPGAVQGVVRFVPDPHRVGQFNQGDILVTGMTRPEFLPIMKKASAIITDVGGVLCHAAVSAREMKMPCIVGTKIATQVFEDGDMVEVDAEKGVVRKIK